MISGVRLFVDGRLLAPILMALAVAIVVGEFAELGRRRRLERIRYRLGHLVTDTHFDDPLPVNARRTDLQRTGARIGRMASRFVPPRIVAAYGALLVRAGRDQQATLPLLITAKLGTSVIGAVLGVVLCSALFTLTPLFLVASILVGFLAGYLVPDMWLQRQIGAYARGLRVAVPSGIDLLTISLEGGLGFEGALTRLCASVDDPFSHEMGIYLQLRSLGHARRAALEHVAGRTDVAELRTFVASVAQGEELGIGIVGTLRDLATDLRTRHRQRVAAQVQTASLRMMIPIVTCIMPSIFIVLLGPAISAVLSSFS